MSEQANEDAEHRSTDSKQDPSDPAGFTHLATDDTRIKTHIAEMSLRTKRDVGGLSLSVGPHPLLLRATEALLTLIGGEGQDQPVDGAERLKGLTERMRPDDLHRVRQTVRTATQALLAVAVAEHKSKGTLVAEAIVERLANPGSERKPPLAPEISQIVNREMGSMLERAGMLYLVGRHARPSTTQMSFNLHAALQAFAAELKSEALRRSMFDRHLQPEQTQQGAIYFDGNALVNVLGKRVEDLAQEPSLMRLPGYAELNAPERLALVTKWLDERGLDSQYTFGSVNNAMASVLKASLLARGKPAPNRYLSDAELCRAFVALVHDWEGAHGSVIDPRILLGLNLAKAAGIVFSGNTPQERLADLSRFVNDVLTEYGGPPRFDERTAALDSLVQESGLSRAQLTVPLRATGKSVLDTFLDQRKKGPRPDGFVATDNGTRISMPPVADRVIAAESAFKDQDQSSAPYFMAWARLRLRIDRLPQTDTAVQAKAAELAKEYQKLQNEAKTSDTGPTATPADPGGFDHCSPIEIMANTYGCAMRFVRENDARTGGNFGHWLDNTPIVSNVLGFAEGVDTGNLEQIINAVPVISNLYNAEEGVRTGDYKRAGMAAVTMVPFAGSVAVIVDGAVNHDAAEVVGGIEGLGLDFLTSGGTHTQTSRGGFRNVVAHSAVDDARVTRRAIPHEAIPPALRVHVDHSLTALQDLGFAHDERALKVEFVDANEASQSRSNARKPISAVTSPDAARLVAQLDGYEVKTRPATLQKSASGMLWDPGTAAHYAEFEGNTYRVAPDHAKTTPQRPIWNVVSPDGSHRIATLSLEYKINPRAREGYWRVAKETPGLKGGGETINIDSVVEKYYEAPQWGREIGQAFKNVLAEIKERNETLELGLGEDVDSLSASLNQVKSVLEKLVAGSIDKATASAEANRCAQAFIQKLSDVGPRINKKLEAVARIKRTVGAVVTGTVAGEKTEGKIMRLMSEAEARQIKAERALKQGGRAFEQHKWFYTDESKLPIANKSSPFRLEINVPKRMIAEIFDAASDDPQGTLEPFRHKPGTTEGNASALEQHEPGAFGVQRFGLPEFSELLDKYEWKLVNLETKKML
ncbi:hypothetical protein C0Z17_26005 [Trinickia caryophylli]|nr:hypothetical protein C0Z17_26005 [Trinickia caryophylli]